MDSRQSVEALAPFKPRRFRNRAGRCYELAWRYLIEDAAAADWTLVHGSINGAYGIIGHAWLERGSVTFDPVLNQMFATTEYERRAQAISRYSQKEAATLSLQHGHFGPWHDVPLLHREN